MTERTNNEQYNDRTDYKALIDRTSPELRDSYQGLHALRTLERRGSIDIPMDDADLEARLEAQAGRGNVRVDERSRFLIFKKRSYELSTQGYATLHAETDKVRNAYRQVKLARPNEAEDTLASIGMSAPDYLVRKLLLIDGAFDGESGDIFVSSRLGETVERKAKKAVTGSEQRSYSPRRRDGSGDSDIFVDLLSNDIGTVRAGYVSDPDRGGWYSAPLHDTTPSHSFGGGSHVSTGHFGGDTHVTTDGFGGSTHHDSGGHYDSGSHGHADSGHGCSGGSSSGCSGGSSSGCSGGSSGCGGGGCGGGGD